MTRPEFAPELIARVEAAVLARGGKRERGEIRFRCPSGQHEDRHPSARWNPAKGAWFCDVCRAGGGVRDLAGRLGVELPKRGTPTGRSPAGNPQRPPRVSSRSRCETVKGGEDAQQGRGKSPSPGSAGTGETAEEATFPDGGLSLETLAAAKHLPVAFLREHGVHDQRHLGQSSVVIPYLDEVGSEVARRYRLRLDAQGQRFSWRRGDKPMLYGLHRLAQARMAGWVLLVEGESDCWTAWYHGLPALGIPGKSTWKREWAEPLQGIQPFLWEEPGAEDLAERVMRDLPSVRIIVAPEGTKDICEAHCRGEDVAALIGRLKQTAFSPGDRRQQQAEAVQAPLRERARAILDAPDPLACVREEIARLGYGGDPRPALITYLCVTTRLLAMRRGAMPAHLLLLGPPAAGKSYTLAVVLLLLPPEAFHIIDAGSPRVLIYDDADLRHRVVVFSEADSLPAGEDNPAASALRNLLQDHRLHYKVTVRDPDTGAFTVHEIEKPGPTLLVTTAVKSLGPQLMTRLFVLPVPEDVARLQQALATQASLELDGATEPSDALIAYQAYLQTLAPWDVVVPFARELSEAIAASANAMRILRDYQRLLSLIKAVTIVRHAHRRQNEAGRWVATIDDYRAVYDLIGPMFEATISGKTETVRRVVMAVAELSHDGHGPVTYSALARKLAMHPEQVKRAVETAIAHEWLVNEQDKPNRPAKLRVGEPMPETAGLPTPETLAAVWAESARVHNHRAPGEGDFPRQDGDFTPSHDNRKGGQAVFSNVDPARTAPSGTPGHRRSPGSPNGGHQNTDPSPQRRRSGGEGVNGTMRPQDDPRFAEIVANILRLTDDEFWLLGQEIAAAPSDDPNLPLDAAAYAAARRMRRGQEAPP